MWTGALRITEVNKDSSEVVLEFSLIDPPPCGGSYTWFGNNIDTFASRVDRFFLIKRIKFLKQRVHSAVSSVVIGRCPILLECGSETKQNHIRDRPVGMR